MFAMDFPRGREMDGRTWDIATGIGRGDERVRVEKLLTKQTRACGCLEGGSVVAMGMAKVTWVSGGGG